MSQISRGSVWRMEKKAFFAMECDQHSPEEVEDSLKERLNDFQRNRTTFLFNNNARSQDYSPKRISENNIMLSKFTRILLRKSEYKGDPKKVGPTQKRLAMIFRATGRCK